MKLVFHNQHKVALQIFWVADGESTPEADEQDMGKLEPDAKDEIKSRAGHVFRIRAPATETAPLRHYKVTEKRTQRVTLKPGKRKVAPPQKADDSDVF